MQNPLQHLAFVPRDVRAQFDDFTSVGDAKAPALADDVHRGGYAARRFLTGVAVVDGHGESLLFDTDTVKPRESVPQLSRRVFERADSRFCGVVMVRCAVGSC